MGSTRTLNDILTAKHLDHIVKRATGEDSYQLLSHELRPASEGITGYLGDHYRVTLHVGLTHGDRALRLFVKTLPMANHGKRDFIVTGNFFRREELMFQLFGELGGDAGPSPWHPKAYLCTDSTLVMPDLSFEGYTSQPVCQYADLTHILVTAASLARFHAAFANYETPKTANGCSFYKKHEEVFADPGFSDSPWLRAAALCSTSLVEAYSTHKDIPRLNEKMTKLFVEACDSLKEYDGTLNVVNHRDLWCNNVLFRYEDEVPANAILIDYQCLRYGPPAFDLTVFLYLQTSREFRECHEKEVCMRYYKIFMESVDEATRKRLESLGYSSREFLKWYERARMLGMVVALGIFPYILMDPLSARRLFDDPSHFDKYYTQDRSEPVLAYCQQNTHYRDRQVDLTEEFVEKYMLNVA